MIRLFYSVQRVIACAAWWFEKDLGKQNVHNRMIPKKDKRNTLFQNAMP
jgi:hypothetical protein